MARHSSEAPRTFRSKACPIRKILGASPNADQSLDFWMLRRGASGFGYRSRITCFTSRGCPWTQKNPRITPGFIKKEMCELDYLSISGSS